MYGKCKKKTYICIQETRFSQIRLTSEMHFYMRNRGLYANCMQAPRTGRLYLPKLLGVIYFVLFNGKV
jgi:hypothetical protein